jgi:hypothetical protein
MRLRIVLLALWAVSLKAQAAVGVCGFYSETYRDEIRPKIQAGVPFELMSVVLADGAIVDKRALRIAFNLWDEIITLKVGEKTIARIPLAAGASEVCKYLELDEELTSGRRYTYRLLLNPLWAERIMRLEVASAGAADNGRMVGVNWHKIASEMPSDKVLLEKELAK